MQFRSNGGLRPPRQGPLAARNRPWQPVVGHLPLQEVPDLSAS